MRETRKIGLIGGMSWESSELYYRLLNEAMRERLGGFHSARCVMTSVDFAAIEAMQVNGEWERSGDLLAAEARSLEAAGAECVLLCTNTMHKVAGQITAAISVPFLDIVDVTADAVAAQGMRRVALLGTRFTMEEPFYAERMASRGIEAFVPAADDRATVNRVIYDELVHGVVRDESRAEYRRIIDRMVAGGAEGVILGCTEIELLIRQEDVTVPAFPTTALHVQAAVDFALR